MTSHRNMQLKENLMDLPTNNERSFAKDKWESQYHFLTKYD